MRLPGTTEPRPINIEVNLRDVISELVWEIKKANDLTEFHLISDGTHPESEYGHRNEVPVGNMVEIQKLDWHISYRDNYLNYMDRGKPTPEQLKIIGVIEYLVQFGKARHTQLLNEDMSLEKAYELVTRKGN